MKAAENISSRLGYRPKTRAAAEVTPPVRLIAQGSPESG
jgi:hypothetical protein